MRQSKNKKLKASVFDEAFEKGDATKYLDLKTARVSSPVHRINIDIPLEILQKVDREASRTGVPRTSLLKIWIAKCVDGLEVSASRSAQR
jgi:hypothetical protein